MKIIAAAALFFMATSANAATWPHKAGPWNAISDCSLDSKHPIYCEWMNDKGEIFQGTNPPQTPGEISAWYERERIEYCGSVRYCVAHDAGASGSPSGAICTGAFDPDYLLFGMSKKAEEHLIKTCRVDPRPLRVHSK